MGRTRMILLIVMLATVCGNAVAAEQKAVPDIDAWANFDFHDTFKVEPPSEWGASVRILDGRQLFALIHPGVKQDDRAVRETEAAVQTLLKVRRIDWNKYMLIGLCGGYSRFRNDARLDLRWLPSGKLEARWTVRETGMGTCTVGAFALVEKSDAELVFTKTRYLDE